MAPVEGGSHESGHYGVRSARATPGPCQAALGGDRQPESLPDRRLAQRIDKVSEPALIRVRFAMRADHAGATTRRPRSRSASAIRASYVTTPDNRSRSRAHVAAWMASSVRSDIG